MPRLPFTGFGNALRITAYSQPPAAICNLYAHMARTQVEAQPALWLRGLIPSGWTHVPRPPDEAEISYHAFGDFPQGLEFIVGAGDASGGKFSGDPRFRRVS
eukprot:884172-Pyramimonas_sp.AAC.1